MRRSRVLITGASGSGTTTLGRALSNHWSVPHAEVDDYFWIPSDPPYVDKRPAEERLALMQALFVPREAWVLSGSMLGWGDSIIEHCDGVIFLSLEPEERLRRLEAREIPRRDAGKFDESAWEKFLAWARGYDDPGFPGRNRARQEAWLAGVDKPVLRLDSAQPTELLVGSVMEWEPGSLRQSRG